MLPPAIQFPASGRTNDVPTRRELQPDRDFLAGRYEIFKKAV